MRQILALALLGFMLSCTSQKGLYHKSPIAKMIDSSKVYSQTFSGVMIYEPATQKTIFAKNEGNYFTPASNTKLFTLYASLKTIGDTIPSLKYVERGDSLIFWGTGDPTLLHPDFRNTKAIEFLSKSPKKKLFFASSNFTNDAYGVGWSWDDYNDNYQTELSPLPLYGNIVRVKIDSGSVVSLNPIIFKTSFYGKNSQDESIKRVLYDNQFFISQNILKNTGYQQDIPMKTSIELTQQLLIDSTNRIINLIKYDLPANAQKLMGMERDTVLRKMMKVSDNMLAEHLLLLCGSATIDTLNSAKIIQYITEKYLQDLPDKPKWVDGSGLSRYNLFTPRTMVKLLDKMFSEYPQDKLFSLMAIGGQEGTLKRMFIAEKPYVFAKTGTLSGVYNLSGYVLTKSGKLLIISFMNNNFTLPTSIVRKEVEKIVNWVYENQ